MPDLDLAEEMALLFQQSATGLTAAAKKHAVMNDSARQNEAEVTRRLSRPAAWPGRADARTPAPGAPMSAQGRTDAPVGWASSPEKIGWVRVSSGPEPEVRFAASDPPPESLTMGEVEA